MAAQDVEFRVGLVGKGAQRLFDQLTAPEQGEDTYVKCKRVVNESVSMLVSCFFVEEGEHINFYTEGLLQRQNIVLFCVESSELQEARGSRRQSLTWSNFSYQRWLTAMLSKDFYANPPYVVPVLIGADVTLGDEEIAQISVDLETQWAKGPMFVSLGRPGLGAGYAVVSAEESSESFGAGGYSDFSVLCSQNERTNQKVLDCQKVDLSNVTDIQRLLQFIAQHLKHVFSEAPVELSYDSLAEELDTSLETPSSAYVELTRGITDPRKAARVLFENYVSLAVRIFCCRWFRPYCDEVMAALNLYVPVAQTSEAEGERKYIDPIFETPLKDFVVRLREINSENEYPPLTNRIDFFENRFLKKQASLNETPSYQEERKFFSSPKSIIRDPEKPPSRKGASSPTPQCSFGFLGFSRSV